MDALREAGRVKGHRARLAWAALLLACLALTAAVYGAAWRLPLFFDDLNQVPDAVRASLGALWTGTGGYSYYRPLGFSLWHGSALAGPRQIPLLHGLSLALHAGNAWLLARMGEAVRQWPAPLRLTGHGWLAAALFLLYPFSYQAIPWVGAQFHLLVTLTCLGAAVTFLRWRRDGQPAWAAFSLVLTFLAPFAHENGLLAAPLILLVAWAAGAGLGGRRFALWWLAAPAWLAVRLAVVAQEVGQGLVSLETMLQNSAYFVQGVAYPATAAGGWLRDWFGWNDLAVAVGLSVAALLVAAWTRRGASRGDHWPAPWIALSVLPAIPLLPFGYVLGGARLLYLASAGITWLWADVAARWLARGGARKAIASLGLAALLMGSVAFLQRQMALHTLPGEAVTQAVAAARAGPSREAPGPALFVNMPSWLAPRRSIFALGHEGVTILPGYFADELLLTAQTPEPLDVALLRYEDLKPQMPYHYEVAGAGLDWPRLIAAGGEVFVARYAPEEIWIERAGALRQPAPSGSEAAGPALASFGPDEDVLLVKATVEPSGDDLAVRLVWRRETAGNAPVTVFVHGLDAAGGLVAQADGHPIAGIYPLSLWPVGDTVLDIRRLPAAGVTRLAVGLYEPTTGERWPAVDGAGLLLANGAVIVPVGPAP